MLLSIAAILSLLHTKVVSKREPTAYVKNRKKNGKMQRQASANLLAAPFLIHVKLHVKLHSFPLVRIKVYMNSETQNLLN